MVIGKRKLVGGPLDGETVVVEVENDRIRAAVSVGIITLLLDDESTYTGTGDKLAWAPAAKE